MQKENPMSTDEENINTASIEEMINANLGIDPADLEESNPEEIPAADELPEVSELAGIVSSEEANSPEVEQVIPTEQSEIAVENADQETIEQAEEEMSIPPKLSNDEMEIDLSTADHESNEDQPTEEVETVTSTEHEENTPSDEAEESPVELDDSDSIENETSELTETPLPESVSDAEPMIALENEVSELESEIQGQLDQFVEQAGNLKSNIQNELQRVSSDNEKLQEQIDNLVQQLSNAEEKIEGFTEVQDKQQATIHKLILIIKGIRTKISHLYDEE